jgi:hypothetical protein
MEVGQKCFQAHCIVEEAAMRKDTRSYMQDRRRPRQRDLVTPGITQFEAGTGGNFNVIDHVALNGPTPCTFTVTFFA